MKHQVLLFAISLCGCFLFGQDELEFGKLTAFEKEFATYEKDTTVNAVYLQEKGENYFEVRQNGVWLISKYHAKKKILDKQGFDEADIKIPYYRSEKSSESVHKIRAITHNGNSRFELKQDRFYSVDVSENRSEIRFVFPDVKEGSILEYTYEIQSPFFFNLTGWEFQDKIPKLYSEYNAKIPGNYLYNRTLVGELSLDVNDAKLTRNCFSVPGIPKKADCEVLRYVMKDIPAFEEDEKYMLSPSNYRSALEFELSEYRRFDGSVEKYTKTWRDVDKEFRSDRDIGGQLRKRNFFEKNVPEDLLVNKEDELTKAKNIYEFVKGYYTWNGKYGIFKNNRVKEAFDEKNGNVAEINITLINLLNAADIETDLMLLSTRSHGLPKRNHPVMSDFNYVVARTQIDGEVYLLDATEKIMPFGMLPFRCLNYYGRVMDLDGDSYWQDIEPETRNARAIRLQMDLDIDNGTANGLFDELSLGHEAVFKKEQINSMSKDEYLEEIERKLDDDFVVESYEVEEEPSDERKLTEHFRFTLKNLNQTETLYFNPFIIQFFDSNPFKAEKRHYPVDFGFLRSYKYLANIKIPEGYEIKKLPESSIMALPGNSGILRFECNESQGSVAVYFDLQLKATQYNSDGYAYLKEFFKNVVTIQSQSYLVLSKI